MAIDVPGLFGFLYFRMEMGLWGTVIETERRERAPRVIQ